MRKKQSTNFIILSLQRHKPLYPQNISLKKKKKITKKQNSFLMTIYTDRSNKNVQRTDKRRRGSCKKMCRETRDIDDRSTKTA